MCRLVRDFHHHHDTWIIVLTPQAHRESASEVWRAGADDCVYTPAPAQAPERPGDEGAVRDGAADA